MNDLNEYRKIFIDVFNVEENDLNEDFKYNHVKEWDSIGHMTLISNIEDHFNIMFETEDILNFTSYLNGMEILRKYKINFE